MKITEQNIKKLSQLARLNLTHNEINNLQNSLEKIVGHIKKIQDLNLKDVKPMTRVDDSIKELREDIVKPLNIPVEKFLQNAPKSHSNAFVVPKSI